MLTLSLVVAGCSSAERVRPEVALDPFLTRAVELRHEMAALTPLVRAANVPRRTALDPATAAAVEALDVEGLAKRIPAGLGTPVEHAALLVYSDLRSWREALALPLRYDPAVVEPEWDADVRSVLGYADEAATDLPTDLDRVRALASGAASAAPYVDSRRAAELAIHLAVTDSMNMGCGAGGGSRYVKPPVIRWRPERADTIEWSGTLEGRVHFRARFSAGAWHVDLDAC